MSTGSESPRPARTTLALPADRRFRDVPGLVLGGIAARFDLPVDRVDDLLLAVDSVLMQDVVGDTARIEADASKAGLVLRLGPYPSGKLDDLALRRVLTRLVDTIEEVPIDGQHGAWVELTVAAHGREGGGVE